MDSRKWLETYDKCETTIQKSMHDLRKYNKSDERYKKNKIKATIEKRVEKSDELLSLLASALKKMNSNPDKYNIGKGEISRRKGMISRLRTDVRTINDQLEGKKSGRFNGRSNVKHSVEDLESDETRNMGDQGIYDQIQQKDKDNDESMDSLLQGVMAIKDMSGDIHGELVYQEKLTDELSELTDRTKSNIRENRDNVVELRQREAGCAPTLIIFLLFVAIIVVAIM